MVYLRYKKHGLPCYVSVSKKKMIENTPIRTTQKISDLKN